MTFTNLRFLFVLTKLSYHIKVIMLRILLLIGMELALANRAFASEAVDDGFRSISG